MTLKKFSFARDTFMTPYFHTLGQHSNFCPEKMNLDKNKKLNFRAKNEAFRTSVVKYLNFDFYFKIEPKSQN